MASNSTLTINNTLSWCSAFCLGRVLSNWNGATNEPALTSANLTYQLLLGAPFVWPWNRNTVSITMDITHTDYTKAVSDWGYIEKCVITDPNGKAYELDIAPVLGQSTQAARPSKVAVQVDDNSGNITFRFMALPDVVYTAIVTYQKAAPLMSALTSTWAPIPDKYAYLYERIFLAHMYATFDYNKYLQELELGLRQAMALQTGLDDAAKNIFLEQFLRNARQSQKVGGRV
jgi:hypothetical protein